MTSHSRSTGRAGFLFVVCALSSAPLVGQVSSRPLPGIFGVYGRLTAGHDSIQVRERADGKISVALKLYYAVGHTCQLKGDGEWRGDHVTLVAPGLDATRQCKLSLFFENGRVVVKDEGLQCAPVYCGTRGKLDEVSLPKFSPSRK
jgi:hypothetical protein